MATATDRPLKAPFPWMGGKARVADLVWDRLGDVDNFVEPFMGSLAVLLRRPAAHLAGGYRVETANDANHYLVNFWRSVQRDPAAVAGWADWPVTEADLHARHKWLVRSREALEFRDRMKADPEHFDPKVAGWWVWGQCCWIGGAWCAAGFVDAAMRPMMWNNGPTGWGLNGNPPEDSSGSLQVPELSSGVGRGQPAAHGRPQLTDAFDIGRGVNGGGGLSSQVPRLGARFEQMDAPGVLNPTHNTCGARRAWLIDWMNRLSDRLRLVRTCYGHWARVCDSDSTLTRLGLTGVFLDPPYPANRGDTGKKSRSAELYATDKGADLDALRDEVLAWCRRWAGPQVRVAVCGYEGDGYEALEAEGWSAESWEASGGYGNQRRGKEGKADNARRERLWFSPACLKPDAGPDLFAGVE